MKKLLLAALLALSFSALGQTLVKPLNGGTGVANANTKTITLGGPLVTSGAFTTTLTATGTTGVTLPTSGTLATTSAGNIPLTALATQATNTVVGNATSGSASPTALAVGTCSTSSSALIWTTNTGFGCNTSINAATLGSATFAAPGAIGGGTPGTGAFTTGAFSTSASPIATFTSTGASGGYFIIQGTGSNSTPMAYFGRGAAIGVGGASDLTISTVAAMTLATNGGQPALTMSSSATPVVGVPGSLAVTGAMSSGTHAITGTITASAIASSGAAQSGYLCYNTTGGVITYDGGATCLISREEYKVNLGPIDNALDTVLALRPFWGAYREDTPMGDKHVQPFLGARYTASVEPRLASYDKDEKPLGVRYENMTAVLTAAIQEQQAMIEAMQREIRELRAMQYAAERPSVRVSLH